MFEKTKIDFTIDGVQGNLCLSSNFMGGRPKLHQDGIELQRKSGFSHCYQVATTDGSVIAPLKLYKGLDGVWTATFAGVKHPLEDKPQTLDYLIGLPFLTFLGGGALGAFCGVLAYIAYLTEAKKQQGILRKIAVCLICFVISSLLCISLAALFLLIVG